MRREGTHYLYADSSSSDGADLQTASAHFTRHSISYNKWRGRQKHLVSHSWVSHQLSGCPTPRLFAVLRHKSEGDMFWDHCFIEVEKERGHSLSALKLLVLPKKATLSRPRQLNSFKNLQHPILL